jgi:hypothetical protein
VLGVLQGLLRDAEKNRRRDGDAVLRELQPAITAAVGALMAVPAAPAPETPAGPVQDKPRAPVPDN